MPSLPQRPRTRYSSACASSCDEGRDIHPAARACAREHLQRPGRGDGECCPLARGGPYRGGHPQGHVAQRGVSGGGERHLRGEGRPVRGARGGWYLSDKEMRESK